MVSPHLRRSPAVSALTESGGDMIVLVTGERRLDAHGRARLHHAWNNRLATRSSPRLGPKREPPRTPPACALTRGVPLGPDVR